MTTHELINQLQMMYHGLPWYGDSLAEKLNSIDDDDFDKRVTEGTHSIRELIEHMIIWRHYALEKLSGNVTYDIELNSQNDWKKYPTTNQDDIKAMLDRLKTTQNQLVQGIKEKEDSWLYEQTPGKQYDNFTLLNGIIQHDVYHLGQIGLIHKLINTGH